MKIYRNNEVEIERTRRCLEALANELEVLTTELEANGKLSSKYIALINELEALITFPPVKKYVM